MTATLNDFTKEELIALAPEYAVELKSGMTKPAIIKAFEEDGVSAELINALRTPTEDDEPVEDAPVVEVEAPADEEDEDLVLVRMIRTNGTYQVRGYTFRRDHPFVLVKESDADYLCGEHEGFRMATPKEAKEYYS